MYFSLHRLPDQSLMAKIVAVHHPDVRQSLEEAIARFYFVRSMDTQGNRHRPVS